MDTLPPAGDGIPATQPESEAERRGRIASEAEMFAEARADIAAGRVCDEAEVDAWIDSIDTDHELPPPHPRR